MKASIYRVLSVTERYAEAASSVTKPSDCAVVERAGARRQLVMCCPDGCGEILSINLDLRSGPAWRLYKKHGAWSLFPSIDRSSGCLSHFILWRGRILWCGVDEEDGSALEVPEINVQRLLGAVGDRPTGFVQVAEMLNEVPWDVLAACRRLAQQGLFSEGSGRDRLKFWRRI
jgi:hypothetical protein